MKKPFLSIDYTKPGKGVKKGSTTLFTFPNFFLLLKRKIWEIIKVNFLWIIVNFPILIGLFALSGKFDFSYQTPADPAYLLMSGAEAFSGMNPALAALMSTAGLQTARTGYGLVTKILLGVSALAVFTFGPANTGMAYMMRGYTKEEYVDMPGDFFGAIKKNLRQSIILGFIDALILGLLFYDLFFFAFQSEDFFFSISFYICLILAFIYLMARFYIYPLLVTFKLSVGKIFKNAFIFSMVGIKRNLVGLLGAGFVIVLNVFMLFNGYTFPIACLLPFLISFALVSFISTYAAWPNIKKIMIDPYYSDTPREDDGEEAVFTDRG